MLFDFFRREREPDMRWRLKPKKFSKYNKYNISGKVLLPFSMLQQISAGSIEPPYTMEISHTDGIYKINCGVQEFTSNEGTITMPNWMYQQLDLHNIPYVTIKMKKFKKGTFVKLLPHSVDFLNVENPKLELEKNLTNYQTLTLGDDIVCEFDEIGKLRFTVVKIQPEGDGIYIVDTDLSVDFAEPVGYTEKIEREKSVLPFVEFYECKEKPRRIKMKKFGLFFDYENVK
ncbi:ubiquitin fusion degradation protein [Binucleata daphniae]